MNKILKIQFQLLKKIDEYTQVAMQRDYPLSWERVHLGSCAGIGQLLAIKRGLDPQLAAIACAVHDYGRIITGKQSNHAENGYKPLLELLAGCNELSDEEIELVAQAAKNHSNKHEVGSALAEIVKDADVLDCYHYGQELARPEQRKRLKKVYAELGLKKQ